VCGQEDSWIKPPHKGLLGTDWLSVLLLCTVSIMRGSSEKARARSWDLDLGLPSLQSCEKHMAWHGHLSQLHSNCKGLRLANCGKHETLQRGPEAALGVPLPQPRNQLCSFPWGRRSKGCQGVHCFWGAAAFVTVPRPSQAELGMQVGLYLIIHLSIYLSSIIYLYIYLLSIYLPNLSSIIYLSIYPSIQLSVIYLSFTFTWILSTPIQFSLWGLL
jgi:hypothetical protein